MIIVALLIRNVSEPSRGVASDSPHGQRTVITEGFKYMSKELAAVAKAIAAPGKGLLAIVVAQVFISIRRILPAAVQKEINV